MIICDKLSKSYGTLNVLNSFSYTFEDHGFYLLFGESGSGKTTLLNVLSGMIPYEGGTITVGDQTFEGRVDPNCFAGGIDYITQDPFFIDFLSVEENMKVSRDNDESIEEALTRFGLLGQLKLPTTVLSGGERERLALARSFLTEKKVLFLDEPTASLDEENKRSVFGLIKELSRTCLVICSSHDDVAKEYADIIIPFEKTLGNGQGSGKNSSGRMSMLAGRDTNAVGRKIGKAGKKAKLSRKKPAPPTYRLTNTRDAKTLPCFLKKWFSSNRRGKKNDLLLGIFLFLTMMLCLLADTPEAKMDSHIEYVYKINTIIVETTSDDAEYFASLEGKYGITDVVLDYSGGVPTPMPGMQGGEDGYQAPIEINVDYELVLETISFDADSFRLSERIEVGTWFQEKNDIILSSEMANALAPRDWASLLGTTIPIKVYGKGTVDFRIVGVLGKMNDFERQYLSSANTAMSAGDSYNAANYRKLFYINSLFTDDYFYDENFYRGEGQRTYQLYFDSYKSLKKYEAIHDKAYGRLFVGKITNGIGDLFQMMFYILLPMAFLIMFLAVLFYGNLIGTELAYNSRFISAFNYAGYDIRDIVRCFTRLNTLRLFAICGISAGITIAVTAVVNLINSKVIFIGFQPFTYNPILIAVFVVVLCICAVVSVHIFLRRTKARSWYENIIASRDLL